MVDKSKVAGGLARANSLAPEERSAIARKAALTRHGKGLPKAIAEGILKIGDTRLACAVLDDVNNTRVFSQEDSLPRLVAPERLREAKARRSTEGPLF